MPQKEILDPQGKAVLLGLHQIELDAVKDVRVGKHIRLVVEADTKAEAERYVRTACEKLLANMIVEEFEFMIHESV